MHKTKLKIHLIFVTKYRKKILIGDIERDCTEIIKNELKKMGCTPIAIRSDNGDHVHIMAEIRPTQSISLIVQKVKQFTAYQMWIKYPELRKHYWYRNWFWSSGYFCSTTGETSSEVVKQYINTQGN